MRWDRDTTWLFLRTFAKVIRDSNATQDLLVGEELTSVGRMDALVPLLASDPEGASILADRPLLCGGAVDYAALARLPEGTLGRAYMDHLARCGLDPEALGTPVTRGSEVGNYLLERVRQTHDLWHTLLGLGTSGHEEVLVHAFQWPQLRMPYSALVVFFGTVKHLVGEGRWHTLARTLPRAFAAGRRARPLLPVRWEWHWEEPIARVRERYGIEVIAA